MIFCVFDVQQQMYSKISNKPDRGQNSPLRATSFPVDLSLFQLSQASSINKKLASPTEAASVHFSISRMSEAQPNLFRYNQRTPLLFSDEEEEDYQQPSFNFYGEKYKEKVEKERISPFEFNGRQVTVKKSQMHAERTESKQGERTDSKQGEPTIKDLLYQKPIKNSLQFLESNKKVQEINLQKTYHIGKKQQPSPIKFSDQSQEQPKSVSLHYQDEWTEFLRERQKKKYMQIMKSEQNKQIQDAQLVSSPSEPIKNVKEVEQKDKQILLGVSKSQKGLEQQKITYHKQRESSKKQESIFSKTDDIIDRVIMHKNQEILIEEQSDQSSQKVAQKSKQKQPKQSYAPLSATVRDSFQSIQVNPHRKRRNRIFDNNTFFRNKSKLDITPQKGVQTQGFLNDSAIKRNQARQRQFDYYPQIKALSVLDKIVDQIKPNITKPSKRNNQAEQAFFQSVVTCTEQLQSITKSLNNITVIQKLEESDLTQERTQAKTYIRQTKVKISKFMSSRIDEELTQGQQRIFRNFHERGALFDVLDAVVQNYKDTKNRLNRLLQSTKGFMINLKRGQFKKIFITLRQMGPQIQTLKAIRAGCGEMRLQKMFKEYLEGEIKPLGQLEQEMRQRVDSMVANPKI